MDGPSRSLLHLLQLLLLLLLLVVLLLLRQGGRSTVASQYWTHCPFISAAPE